jgi:hypothetical protein
MKNEDVNTMYIGYDSSAIVKDKLLFNSSIFKYETTQISKLRKLKAKRKGCWSTYVTINILQVLVLMLSEELHAALIWNSSI